MGVVRPHGPGRQPVPAHSWPVCRLESLGEQVAGGGWTLVEFWAPDNLFCRLMEPVRVGLAASHAARLRLICCTLDSSGGEAAAYGAIAIPALILFRQGRRVRRWLGAIDRSVLRYHIDLALRSP